MPITWAGGQHTPEEIKRAEEKEAAADAARIQEAEDEQAAQAGWELEMAAGKTVFKDKHREVRILPDGRILVKRRRSEMIYPAEGSESFLKNLGVEVQKPSMPTT